MTTREDIKKVMAYMGCAFPNYHPEISEGGVNAVDVMEDLLGDLPKDTLMAAVKACCAEPGRAFAPSAGEIRGMAVSLHVRAAGVPSAGEAWAAVIESFERMPSGVMAGGGHTPTLDNPIVQEAVKEMGGYAAIGVDFYDNLMPNRAHFLKIYAALLARHQEDAATLPEVAGYIESRSGEQIRALTDKLTKRIPARVDYRPPSEREIAIGEARAAAFDRGEKG